MPEILGEKKYLIVVTSRIRFAKHDVMTLGANPNDPRILYIDSDNMDRLSGLDRKTPWIDICMSCWSPSEKDYAMLEERFGKRQPSLEAALKKTGIPMGGP